MIGRAEIKLNLGSNRHRLEGYENIDILAYEGVDLVADVFHLPHEDGSVEEIYAGHLLEHLANPIDFFLECWRVLRPDGLLSVVIPDVTAINRQPEMAVGILFGFQLKDDRPDRAERHDLHRSWWSRDLLLAMAEQCGFLFLKDIDPRGDPRLVARVYWQTGIDFRKGRRDPLIPHAASLYRRVGVL